MFLPMYIYLYLKIHNNMYFNMYVSPYIYVYIYIFIYIYIIIYIYIYIYVHITFFFSLSFHIHILLRAFSDAPHTCIFWRTSYWYCIWYFYAIGRQFWKGRPAPYISGGVVQCVAVYCSVFQSVVVCRSVLCDLRHSSQMTCRVWGGYD